MAALDYSPVSLTTPDHLALWAVSRPADPLWLPPGWDRPDLVAWRQQRFEAVLEVIDEAYQQDLWSQLRFAQLGHPTFSSIRAQTAAVALRPNGTIDFLFHPRFFDLCEPARLVFAVVHERFHIDFDHLRRGTGKFANLWNIVIDIIVNELCHHLGFLPADIARDYWSIEKLLPGFNYIGEDIGAVARFRTEFDADRLYTFLLSIAEKIELPPFARFALDMGFGMGDDDTPDQGEAEGGLGDPILVDVGDSDAHEAYQERVREAQEQVGQQGSQPPSTGWGHGDGGAFGETVMPSVPKPRTHTWLDEVATRIYSQTAQRTDKQWAVPPRRLVATGIYGKVFLPSVRKTMSRVREVLLVGDCSGSMDHKIPSLITTFLEMIDHFRGYGIRRNPAKVSTYAFDDYVYFWPEELLRRKRAPHAGGTNFQAIADFVEGRTTTVDAGHGHGAMKMVRHPDLVVVVTDGECRPPTVAHPESWVWLCVERHNSSYYVGPQTQGIGQVLMWGDIYDGEF